jgi:PAS domain S-box-containing protein
VVDRRIVVAGRGLGELESVNRRIRWLPWLLILLGAELQAFQPVTIGVLSHRGDATTMRHWSKTADYLNENLPAYRFFIQPLDFSRIDQAVAGGEVDFILVNPAIYVNLEVRHRVSRIATMRNRLGDEGFNVFGGVIFARAERYDLNSLADLRGASLMAVSETSLGGYMMAVREFKDAGIHPGQHLQDIRFVGTHDQVVMAVREGRVDAGTVRTDILERMQSEGQIAMSEFRIIHALRTPGFPLVHSTRLYPEWPFSKVAHISNELAGQVAIALAEMPEHHPAARSGNYAGWSIPLDYQPVHGLLRELKLPPYVEEGGLTLMDVWRYYWTWLLGGLFLLLSMGSMTTWVWRLNQQLAQAKHRLEQQHALILDSVVEGVFGVDNDGRTTFVNRAMEQITGWRSEDLLGMNQHALLHRAGSEGDRFPVDEYPVTHTFGDSQVRYVEEDVFWCKDGRTIPVEYSCNPLVDDNGQVSGAVVVFRDISARKQAAEEARQHQNELAHVARLSTMGEMASGIAHELNQPLSAISNYTRGTIRMLRGEVATDHAQLVGVMERVAAQAERAGEIIRQLRRFVRKEDPEHKWVAVNRLVRELARFLQPELHREGIRLALRLDEDLPPVWAHDIQLEQVLLNLVRNAMEAILEGDPDQRIVRIRTALEGERLAIAVQDSGPGIDETILQRLFEPFVTTKKQGMGLGLSISRGIIEAHGGRLRLDANADNGTTFQILLPLEKADEG